MARLIALEDVKGLLPIRSGNVSYDARLSSLIDTVSKMIETECRASFEKKERTEYHTPRDTVTTGFNLYGDGPAWTFGASEQIIPLRAAPVDPAIPVSIWYDPSRVFDQFSVIDPSHYWVDPDLSRIVFRYPTKRSLSSLKVSYTAGYAVSDGSMSEALDELAPDLKQGAILGVLHLFKRESSDFVGTNRATEDGKLRTPPLPNSYGLPAETLNLIAPYRRVLTGRG